MAKQVMTRAQMVAIIRSGESVMHNSRLITTEAELPSAVEMAAGTPGEAEALIAAKIKERDEADNVIKALEAIKTARTAGNPEVTENADSSAANGSNGAEGSAGENGAGTTGETGETGTSKDALTPKVKTKTVGIQ